MKLSNKRIINDTLGKYYRALETPSHIYFVNFKESDENSSVKMYDRKMNLVSDNYFAYVGMMEDIENDFYSWVSPKMKEAIVLIKKEFEENK
jgi:hypothetical protein